MIKINIKHYCTNNLVEWNSYLSLCQQNENDMTQTFNSNEVKVLTLLAQQMKECTGGEFGYMPDTDRGEFTKHQFAGYVGDLKNKGAFEYISTSGGDYQGQFALKEDIYKQFK